MEDIKIVKEKHFLKATYYVAFVICLFFIAYSAARVIINASNIFSVSLALDSPNEVRDFVSFRLTNYIMRGINPYTIDFIENAKNPFALLYQGLNPLIVALYCLLTGQGIVKGYYIINIMWAFMTVFNIWLILEKYIQWQRKTVIVCIALNTITFFAIWKGAPPLFSFLTDAIGIYISSIIFLLATRDRYSPLVLSVLTVLLIFTKQILICLAAPLFVYLFIRDRKKALNYVLFCIVVGIITFSIVQIFFPLYWTETIYAQWCVSKDYGGIQYAKENIKVFYLQYKSYWILSLMIILLQLFKTISNGPRKWNKTVIDIITKHHIALYMLINIIFGTVFLLYFAKCEGDGYKYCQDFLAASLFILTVYLIYSVLGDGLIKEKAQPNKDLKYRSIILLLILTIITVSTTNAFMPGWNQSIYTKDDIYNIIALDNEIAQHDGEAMYLGIYSTQYITQRNLYDNENIYFDDGNIEYFQNYSFIQFPVIDKLFIGRDEIKNAAISYHKKIDSYIQEKKFGVITICISKVINREHLSQNYEQKATYYIHTEVGKRFPVEVWVPKEE